MKKKVVFVLPTLQGGGAEKVVSSIALNLNKKKYDTKIIVFDLSGQKYLKNQNIGIVNLKSKKISTGVFHFIKTIHLLSPDILITSVSHLNVFTSFLKVFLPRKTKLLVRESNFLSNNMKLQSNYLIMKILYKFFYNNIDKLIVFSRKHKLDVINNTNISIIGNPIDFDQIKKLSKKKINTKFKILFQKKITKLVYVGSLSYQKGLDIFINSLALVNKKSFIFNIVGSGSEKENLINLTKIKKLKKKVNFIPYQVNPYPYIKASDVFIMCSRFEGMSNTVLETLSMDKPIIYLNNTGASTDLLKKIKNSYLINSNDPYFISKKINNYKIPLKNKSNFSTLKKFKINNILRKYEKILDDIF